jgi:hypothetical protein
MIISGMFFMVFVSTPALLINLNITWILMDFGDGALLRLRGFF